MSRGRCTTFASPGRHGNVASRSVDAGDVLVIPAAIGYTHIASSAEHTVPAAADVPASVVIPQLGVQNVVYAEPYGHLFELWRDGSGQTGAGDLTAASGAPGTMGRPYAYVDTNTAHTIVLYRGRDRHVHSLRWSTGAVGHDNLSLAGRAPIAAGDPVGYFTPATDTHHVIYRTYDNHLRVLWWSGTGHVGHDDATALAGAPFAAGDPSAFVDTSRGRNVVVYRGFDGHVRSLYWTEADPVTHADLSGFCGAPDAVGDPAAGYSAVLDASAVVYRAANGNLVEIYSAGTAPAAWWDLTAIAGAPPTVDDPAVYYERASNTRHVVYRSADGHLNELWWTPGGGIPQHVDLTVKALAPPALDSPSAYTVEGPNTQHVVYRGLDKMIHEIRWV